MKKYTHIVCLEDVIEDGIIIFKKGETYPIVGFDYHSFVYYAEPEYYEDDVLPAEFAISPVLNKSFKFITL